MSRSTPKFLLVAMATVAITLGLPATGASAQTLSLPPICQSVPGSYPGATVSIGGNTVHVPSVGNIRVCLYQYAVTTTGAPLPQTYSGCGAVCFKIDSPGMSASAAPYVQITLTSDGTPLGYTYVPPPVSVGYTEPVCVSVGTPAPACTSAVVNLTL